MFSVGPNYPKLKTNLRLAVNRLKLLEKRKTELAQKMRKDIAECISQGKEDRARIRVEHIIREDYSVEALELVEMLCELLLARFDLIQHMKMLDDGLEEPVNSILWAAPRISTEVPELKEISDQLSIKYGRMFVDACRENRFAKVNTKLLQKLSVQAPSKVLVEKYMVEIAKSHGVEFNPNMKLLHEEDFAAAEALLIDFQNKRSSEHPGASYVGNVGYGEAGATAPALPDKAESNMPTNTPGPYDGLFDLPDPPAYDVLPTSGLPTSAASHINAPVNTEGTQTDTKAVNDNVRNANLGDQYDAIDYDDLLRRFEELKKRR